MVENPPYGFLDSSRALPMEETVRTAMDSSTKRSSCDRAVSPTGLPINVMVSCDDVTVTESTELVVALYWPKP